MVTSTESSPITVSVLGASGYSGQELLRRLALHQGVKILHAFAQTSAGMPVADLVPSLLGRMELHFEPYSLEAAREARVAFVALPSGEALKTVPELLEQGMIVIDLGGDFRLKDSTQYAQAYGRPHPVPELLNDAVYGLSEWNRSSIAGASLIANPGCYPTSVLLPVLPLLRENVVESTVLRVSSMSGVSGAGRSAALELSFAEVNESVRAYKVGVHQHRPEMETFCKIFAGTETKLDFVAHLLPITRGIYTTIFASPRHGADLSHIRSVFESYYGVEPFVRLLNGKPPELARVCGSNRIDISAFLDARTGGLTIFSAIDNLVKGAAGQAIQNFNIRFGFNETEGLE